MGRLFGTDGARGVANSELTCELAMSIGKAAAMVLIKEDKGEKPTVFIGKDTRLSSDMLEGALTAGLCSVGADVVHLGVLPPHREGDESHDHQGRSGLRTRPEGDVPLGRFRPGAGHVLQRRRRLPHHAQASEPHVLQEGPVPLQ